MVRPKITNPKKQFAVSLDEELINDVKTIQSYLSGADNLSGLINTLLEHWKKENKEIIEGFKCEICGGKTEGLYISTCRDCKDKRLDESEKNGKKLLKIMLERNIADPKRSAEDKKYDQEELDKIKGCEDNKD